MKLYNLVYKTTNLINGMYYIGKHSQYNTSAFDGYFGSGTLLLEAIKEFGKDNFIRENIEFCDNEFEAYKRESFWVCELSACDRSIGYNILPGGSGLDSKSSKEILSRPDVLEKISIASKKNWEDPDFKEKTLKIFRNIWDSQEHKNKMSQVHFEIQNRPEIKSRRREITKGLWQDEEWRKNQVVKLSAANNDIEKRIKQSITIKKNWEDPDFRKAGLEHLKNLSARPDIRLKISEKMKEYSNRPEVKDATSKRMKGNTNNSPHNYILKDPAGNIIETNNLNLLCRKEGLIQTSMQRVVVGKQYSHKGWTGYIVGKEHLIKNKEEQIYVFKDPQGNIWETNCLKEFCRKHDLYQSCLGSVALGKRKHHKNWTFVEKFLRKIL